MRKILRFILSLTATSVAIIPSIVTIACTAPIIDEYVEIFRKYYNDKPNNPYARFNIVTNDKLRLPVSDSENKKFNALYDDGTAPKTWDNFLELGKDLTTTQISPTVTVNIDWSNMYDRVHLNASEKQTALEHQLRFYNILAKLYQKENVLKLLQWVAPTSVQEGNIVAYTEYYAGINSQTQTYGPSFADKTMIDNQFHGGFWSSDDITTVSTHEYGHALSNFLGATNAERNRFNRTRIDHRVTRYSQDIKLNKQFLTSSFSDRTQVLINFLDEIVTNQKIITLSDDIEKFLLAVITVSSGYSHSAWTDNDIEKRDEFFAEAFAYWMLTPENLRDIRWGLLNDFFIDYVPVYYSL